MKARALPRCVRGPDANYPRRVTEVLRTAAVVGFEERVFLQWESKNAQGLRQTYAITETTRQPATLGHDLKQAVDAPWPDISPAPMELIKALAKTAGVSSYTRFVTRSTYAGVMRDGRRFEVTPWKPNGRAGYNGVWGGPHYELTDPTDAQLGEAVLRALRDSLEFPDRPTLR